jgi:hypothetical protein
MGSCSNLPRVHRFCRFRFPPEECPAINLVLDGLVVVEIELQREDRERRKSNSGLK